MRGNNVPAKRKPAISQRNSRLSTYYYDVFLFQRQHYDTLSWQFDTQRAFLQLGILEFAWSHYVRMLEVVIVSNIL